MGVFPKNEHMKIGMYFLSTIGVWKLNLKEYPKLDKLYRLYSNVMYYYFLTFVSRQIIEFFRLILTGGSTLRIMQNCSLTLLTAISAVRVAVVRGKTMQKITDHIIAAENKVRSTDEEELTKIYNHNVWMSQMASKFFIMVGTITASPFYYGPTAEANAYPELYKPDNITGKIHKRLPLSAWVPYDYKDHYWISYLWQVADGWTAECYVVYTDAFLFGLMIFPVGQMKMLQYMLKNFKRFAEKVKMNTDMSYEESSYITARECALYHKEIISYVELLDDAMRMLMLMDFASCSIQMSVLVFQVIMSDINIPMIFALIFLWSMVIQLFLFYWNANEITVEGMVIAKSIWEGDWYEETKEVKKTLQILMMRAQKPLTVSIGPFYPMSTDTALSILKATYSYAMLIRQSYLRKL